jgi:hypothetical protein
MKLATIPPLCWPYRYNESSDNYKLILPMHWQNQHHYEASMLNHRRGGFTILDNGVAEGVQYDWAELQKIARRYYVNEMVLPDVIGDMSATKEAVEATMEHISWMDPWGYMGVVQGTTFSELCALADFYGGLQGGWGVQCIGIPRHLLSTVDPDIRYHIARHIRSQDSRIEIHLLGTNPVHMDELQRLGDLYRAIQVRGVDTSAPFVYAQAHIASWIGSDNVIARPEEYFDLKRSEFDKAVLAQNFDTLVRWVHG